MDDFSLRFIDSLRNAGHPALREMADRAVELQWAMRFDSTSPAGHHFWVTTESEPEVTIGLGRHWHTHLDEFQTSAEDEKPFANVIQFLLDLIREQIIIIEWFVGEKYLGSNTQRRGEKSPKPGRANRRVNFSWPAPSTTNRPRDNPPGLGPLGARTGFRFHRE
jgi:hypothetical protein